MKKKMKLSFTQTADNEPLADEATNE